ncbi:MAG: hypothetical protein QMD00_04895 [Hadesarchaea archaeon]|nr:hypothetical protein [Hadesarchaea archaeon]
MVTEIWPEHITSKSWRVLNELAARVDPVLIGGWAVHLWTGALKSADVDLFVTDENMWKIGARVKKHPKLKKYHALIDDVDIDIYTPSVCGLAISAGEAFEKRWYALVRGFNVLLPEPLLVLKCEAARARWAGRKGFKDRCDVLSLLRFERLDLKMLGKLLLRYKELGIAKTLREIVQKSVEEYRVLGLDSWGGRKSVRGVLKKIVP